MNVLFVCSQNRLRSPTAAAVFAGTVATRSAGTAHDARQPITEALLAWADLVVCMEREHRIELRRRWPEQTKGKRMAVIDVADDYDYMQPALVEVLRERVPHLFARV